MQNSSGKNISIALSSLLILGATFFVGLYIGRGEAIPEIDKVTTVENKEKDKPESVDFSSFWKVWNIINEKYAASGTSTKEVSDKEKVYGAITGLTESLNDPYTAFFPPEEKKAFEEEISGNFEGVGMEIGIRENVLTVISPIRGTPAYKAGILPGDKILQINGKSTADLNTEEAVKMIRGKAGTQVTLSLLRNGDTEPIEVKVTRARIDLPTIETELLPEKIYIIRIFNFSAISPNLFRNALKGFIQARTNKLIIDLRGNPGGYLEAAIDMASWFLPAGKTVVIEDFRGDEERVVHRSKGYDIFSDFNLRVVVLIDKGSASASEILAGALKENGLATLVGEKSFGKGSVQELVKVTSDTSLKITIAQWLTPNGNSISQNGLVPDIEVKRTAEDIQAGRDPQQDRAIQLLSN